MNHTRKRYDMGMHLPKHMILIALEGEVVAFRDCFLSNFMLQCMSISVLKISDMSKYIFFILDIS